ncbi:transcriptional regulator [Streptomyces sp. NBC_00243]|uniref:transcriptional regulator n=1 Tax=Streptomyces sp. NBC_00243 TaxID=2975688 RepID=UPI002DD902E2|nr:transcriptional regulator [Streptomyces sp. NBC_00243]WRZ20133.1 transcriptional regulator [Streptomyces sp. NBC_00243]
MNTQLLLGLLGALTAIGGLYYAWRALDHAAVEQSRATFVKERTDLRHRFGQLCETAADMQVLARPSLERIGGSSLLWEETMRPPAPLPLSAVVVEWQDALPPVNLALLRAARRCLPKESKAHRYERYSSAMGALARPTLFEDRPSFRLTSANWSDPGGPRLVFSNGQYFDLVDQNEAVAHELAVATSHIPGERPPWRAVPMRRLLADDPLLLEGRVVLPAVGTLTLRRTPDGQGTFFLLYREAGHVATGEGTYGPLPAGMVQPASFSPLAHRQDLDLWRTVMREYNEELLGAPEARGDSGTEVNYDQPPYSLLNAALADGSLRVWCLGMALEPLNLAVCILTVAVFEADTFDTIFADAVERNEEGIVISGPRSNGTITGLPLDAASVNDLPPSRMSSPAAGLLQLALRHRNVLLSGPDHPQA